MTNFILNVILWTFALYGFFEIIKTILRTYIEPRISSNGIYLFIAVKNEENRIEVFIRSILFRIIYGKEENIDNIFVLDLNSTDRTSDILNLISKDYDFIKYTDIKNCKEMLDAISQK